MLVIDAQLDDSLKRFVVFVIFSMVVIGVCRVHVRGKLRPLCDMVVLGSSLWVLLIVDRVAHTVPAG